MLNQLQIETSALRNYTTYLWSLAFVAGNVLFPLLCHMTPFSGKELLPIMLFTLIAGVRFGLGCALLTAIISPLISSLAFGMPAGIMLVAVLNKSIMIALVFGLWKMYKGSFNVVSISLLALAVQLICFIIEGGLMFGFQTAWSDLLISYPGVILQIIAGVIVRSRR